MLVAWEGLSYEEVALVLDTEIGTVARGSHTPTPSYGVCMVESGESAPRIGRR